jgi:hypothetical protein
MSEPMCIWPVSSSLHFQKLDTGFELGKRGEAEYGRQDYPNMSDRGEQYLTRVAASETIKSFGNEAFNTGDFVTANRKYTKVGKPSQHKQYMA